MRVSLPRRLTLTTAGLCCVAAFATVWSQSQAPKKKAKGKQARIQTAGGTAKSVLLQRVSSVDEKLQRDFPDLCLDTLGQPWICYIEHDANADTLHLGKIQNGALEHVAMISQPGVLHHPSIARDGSGGIWCVWGQADDRQVMTLRARRFADGKSEAEITLASSEGSDTFADAGTDGQGRVWVAWQSMRRGQGDVLARWLDPAKKEWSKEIPVNPAKGGNWEPRLAFDDKDGAWIAYDGSRAGDFNLYLARVTLDGKTTEKQLTTSNEYEARAAVAWDGKSGLWIAGERGRRQWGMESRGHEIVTGFNGQKGIFVGHYDIASKEFTEVAVPDNGRPAPAPVPSPAFNVNIPSVALDAAGDLWVASRVCNGANWRVALMKYDAKQKHWMEPVEVPDSTMAQDRRNELTRAADGSLWLCWPSDLRSAKACGVCGVYAAKVDTKAALDALPQEGTLAVYHLPEPVAYRLEPAKDRPRDQHHTWTIGGKTYHLLFGDLHRHTDISNCRTGGDGCIAEHFRYGYDVAGLDFMGTSDHSDQNMGPYEWWHTQRMVDAFYSPGKFNSLYAYEREQHYPWGHRNVVFAERGGPVVYIARQKYRASVWQESLPVKPGIGEITPVELWDVLSRQPHPVALISHTGATGMGTDWDKYDRIDGRYENTVEIFQGARVSYEGLGAPQPLIGLRASQNYTPDTGSKAVIPPPPEPIEDFGEQRNNGVYQRALADGHKLGVFASSDHISQHCSFGGVYVEEITRHGIIEGFKARHSIAATDKIFIEFSANGRPMGEVFETSEKPRLTFAIDATAPLKRVTMVRNEKDWKVMNPSNKELKLDATVTDDAPLAGENRYYLRVEQEDGSMGWSSPVWVKIAG